MGAVSLAIHWPSLPSTLEQLTVSLPHSEIVQQLTTIQNKTTITITAMLSDFQSTISPTETADSLSAMSQQEKTNYSTVAYLLHAPPLRITPLHP